MNIEVLPLPPTQKKPRPLDESALGFGRVFTDRMLLAEWRAGEGWSPARIQPYAGFTLDPACSVLHYGQEIFEGLKAYRQPDGGIALFRPEMNARRFNRSAERLCMPQVPEESFLGGIAELVRLERDWVPAMEGTALYIRPTMIAVQPALGLGPADRYYFYVLLSPVGGYYADGFVPLRIMIEDRYVRAVPGGMGEAKTGGNYAASLRAAQEAREKGFDQVLWLDGIHHRYVEEVGVMNIFFVYADHVATPALSGSILPGVTRDSVLKLAPELGYPARERRIALDEVLSDIRTGRVKEAFGTGTAAVITPIGHFGYRGETMTVGDGGTGRLTRRLYEVLTGIQYGKIEDKHGWVRRVV